MTINIEITRATVLGISVRASCEQLDFRYIWLFNLWTANSWKIRPRRSRLRTGWIVCLWKPHLDISGWHGLYLKVKIEPAFLTFRQFLQAFFHHEGSIYNGYKLLHDLHLPTIQDRSIRINGNLRDVEMGLLCFNNPIGHPGLKHIKQFKTFIVCTTLYNFPLLL